MSESSSALSNTQDIKPHQKIEIVVRNERQALKFALKKTARLDKVYDAFANQLGIQRNAIRFTFDGEALRGGADETPEKLEMTDGDEIEAHLMMEGGGD